MSILCTLGLHRWQDSCICERCDLKRNEHHTWEGCVCTRCHTVRNEEHNWDGCICIRCHSKRSEEHKLEGCKCIRCGDTFHEWEFISESTEKSSSTSGKYPDEIIYVSTRIDTIRKYRCKKCGETNTTVETKYEDDQV